ncbi:MAG: adenylate/guanylate cyclase domain-containing protein [Opitutaceae bacterium]
MASQKKSALFRLRWLLLAPIPLAWCVVAHLGLLSFLENKMLDWRFRFRGPIDCPAKVVYVDIDSQSTSTIGNVPWNREYFATVARALIEHAGVKAVGMDLVFSDAGLPESVDTKKLIAGNRALGSYLRNTPSVIVGASYAAADVRDSNGRLIVREFPDVNRPDLPPVNKIEPPETPSFNIGRSIPFSPPGVALIDTVDGDTRWVRLFAPTAVRTYYAMAVELVRICLGVDRDGLKIEGDHLDMIRPDGTLATRIPLVRHQSVEINWFSHWIDAKRNPRVSFVIAYLNAQMLGSDDPKERKTAEEFFAQDDFKDAVVLIGPVDPLIQDIAPTPMDDIAVPRVGVHGNLFKTIMSGAYLRRLPEWGAYALIFGLSSIVSMLAIAGGGRAVFAKIMAGLILVGYVAIAFQLFKTGNFIIPVVAPIGATFMTSFVGLGWQIVEEQKQKGRIKGMFGAYVAPALVARMVDSGEEPKLGGIEENITGYFSDIQSFSSFSEKLSPSRLVELMNEYLTACTDIVQAEGGTLDKYIGDAVVAIYGAPLALPDHPLRASVAALRVHRRVSELREKWRHEGDRWPDIVLNLQTRIGLNTGPAVVGNMGSHTRFNYTMMGDNVNIAARMESGAKSWGVYSMCTESTRSECERIGAGRVVFRALGRIIVKGRTQPLPIHELVALAEDATDPIRQCIATFEQGLARYYARDWDGAIGLFRRSEALEPNGPGRAPGSQSNPSQIYIRIAEGFRIHPPPEQWDGVFEMKEK